MLIYCVKNVYIYEWFDLEKLFCCFQVNWIVMLCFCCCVMKGMYLLNKKEFEIRFYLSIQMCILDVKVIVKFIVKEVLF